MEKIRDSEDFKETIIKVKSRQKRAKKVRLNVFWIPHMSGYPMDLIKPIRDNEDFKGAFRNVKNGPKKGQQGKKGDFQRSGSLDTLFSWLWERLKLFWTPQISA